MKAEVKYSNGYTLVIPKYGNAPMLFMEWLSKFSAGRNWLHKVHQNLDDCFAIRLNMKKEEYEEAAQYINDVVTIDLKTCYYPYAIRNAIELALELDGYDASTIKEVFNQMPDAKCEPSPYLERQS